MGLDNLEGIRGGSRVQGTERNVVEKLMEVCQKVVNNNLVDGSGFVISDGYRERRMYSEVKKELDTVEFDKKDLDLFITVMGNGDYYSTN